MNFAVGGSVIEGITYNYLTKQMGIICKLLKNHELCSLQL